MVALLLVAISFTGARADGRGSGLSDWKGLEQSLNLTAEQQPQFESLVQAHLASYMDRRAAYHAQVRNVFTPAQLASLEAAQATARSQHDRKAVRQAWKDAVAAMSLTPDQVQSLRSLHMQAQADETLQRDKFTAAVKSILTPQQQVVFDAFMKDRHPQQASSQE